MTEKDYNPEQKQMKAMKRQKTANKTATQMAQKVPVKKEEKTEENKIVETKDENQKPEEKKEEKKKIIERTKVKERSKKTEAVVNLRDLPISTKHSMAICDFIRKKKISTAISQLEEVLKFKRVVPMKGEIPHRHGKGIMAGRYPIKATENFIRVLKSLAANAVYNGIEEPFIVKAVANLGARPYSKFGAVRKKRTHLEIVVKEKVRQERTKKKSKAKKKEQHENAKEKMERKEPESTETGPSEPKGETKLETKKEDKIEEKK